MLQKNLNRAKHFMLLWSLFFVGFSQLGYSFISLQGLVGLQQGKMTLGSKSYVLPGQTLDFPSVSGNLKGVGMEFSGVLDPIPLIPVGVGLNLTIPNLSGKLDDDDTTLKGFSIGAFITAWSPISFLGLTPFAKAGMRLYSAFDLSSKTDGSSFSVPYQKSLAGWDASIGLKYAIIPMIRVLAQFKISGEKFPEGGLPVPSNPIPNFKGPSLELATTTISVGVEVGI